MDLWKNRLIIAFLLIPIFLGANTDELREKLFEKYQKIITLQADFSQKNYWHEQDIEQISQGKLYYDADNLLLEYSLPEGQKLLMQKNDILIYDKQSNQLIKSQLTTEMNKFRPIEILRYYWTDNEVSLKKQEGSFLVEIIPETTDFKKIIAEIDAKSYLIIEIRYLDNQEDMVEFKFENQKLNKEISQEKFELNLPEDVNIIEN